MTPISDATVVLSADELSFLRFSACLYPNDESPLGAIDPDPDAPRLSAAARALVERGLLDKEGFRPDRDLVRRLLIASEPDARVVLFASGLDQGEPVLDFYERAGALVLHKRAHDAHELSAPVELDAMVAKLLDCFSPRRSTGDFVDFALDAAEWFSFSVLASDLLVRRGAHGVTPGEIRGELPAKRVPVPHAGRDIRVVGASLEAPIDDEGTAAGALLDALPQEPARAVAWRRALDGLVAKEVCTSRGDRYVLRPYLHDLALGLAARKRRVLTRFDFGEEDWIVRDTTFVEVPGSVFLLRAAREGAIRVTEVDASSLASVVRSTVEPDRAG